MGEIAEMMLEGILCEQCGEYIDGAESEYPRLCPACQLEAEEAEGEARRDKKGKSKRR